MPTKTKHPKLAAQAYRHLLAAHYRSIGDESEESDVSPIDLYHRFLTSGMEEKGSYSFLYSEKGMKGGLDLNFDFGEFILPFLTISLGSATAATGTLVLLPCIHRPFPVDLYAHGGQTTTRWFTRTPIGLLVFTGKNLHFEQTINVELGVSLYEAETSVLTVDTIEVGAGISLNGEVGVHLQVFSSKGESSVWYATAMDSSLVADFNSLFLAGRQYLIADSFFQEYRSTLDGILDPRQLQDEELASKIKKNLIGKLSWIRRKRKGSLTFTAAIMEIVEELFKISQERDLSNDPVGSEILKRKIEGFQKQFDALKTEPEPGPGSKAEAGHPDHCFLDYTRIHPHAAASAAAAVNLIAEASVEVKAETDYQIINSRYQTYAECPEMANNLVMTQDTVIVYQQTLIGGEASAAPLPEAVLEKLNLENASVSWEGQKVLKNSMRYSAATCFWLFHQHDQGQEVHLEAGSGISFGLSVRFGALFEMAKDLSKSKDGAKETAQNLKLFASSLKVTEEQLKAFVQNLFPPEDLQLDSSKAFPELMGDDAILDHVLLEAAFSYKENELPSVIKTTESKLPKRKSISNFTGHSDYKKLFKKGTKYDTLKEAGLQLESIRIRIRLADKLDELDEGWSFKLGFSIRDTGFEFHLARISDWGNEAVFTFHTQYFKDDLPVTWIDEQLKREQGVPPVFFPPHS